MIHFGKRGFKSPAVDLQYRLGEIAPEEAELDTCFFRASSVKSIGETYHSEKSSRSAESAATWGSCGKFQEEKE